MTKATEAVRQLYRLHMRDDGLYGPGEPVPFVYYRGDSLARDRKLDPALDAFADEVLLDSDADKPGISPCGHERFRWKGTGKTRMYTAKDRDAVACMVVRAKGER